MEKFVVIFGCCLIFSNFICILTYENSECSTLKEGESSPRECCEFPILYVNQSTLRTCFTKCPTLKPYETYENVKQRLKAECCLVRCFHEAEEVLYKNGTTDLDNMKYSFRTRNGDVLDEEWQKVVDAAVDKCGSKFPKTDTVEDCLPSYHRRVYKCSYISSFMNCVNYNQTEKCIALKKTVHECSNSNYMTFEDWSVFFA